MLDRLARYVKRQILKIIFDVFNAWAVMGESRGADKRQRTLLEVYFCLNPDQDGNLNRFRHEEPGSIVYPTFVSDSLVKHIEIYTWW